MKRRPRKIITRVIVFLLLGAIINVAVAWGCIFNPSTILSGSEQQRELGNDHAKLLADIAGRHLPVGEPDVVVRYRGMGVQWLQIGFFVGRDLLGWANMVQAGWPMGCLTGGEWRMPLSPADNRKYRLIAITGHRSYSGIARPLPVSRHFPFQPIWPGFALNTVFYAAMLWLLFAAPFALRRRGRIKRGLCPACAYPLGDSPVCTECGAAVNLPAARNALRR